ncbi:hypothetical protein AGMMS4957_04260 [Bacteroidia bacterium]|nr:hypothetical protein AGMMS4957_04260 [Bacteroidia bacterium]
MKTKYLICNLGILAMALCLSGCAEESLKDLLVDQPVTIVIGNKRILTVNSIPEGVSIPQSEVKWSSENPLIAIVNDFGLMEAVEAGSTNILASYNGITKTIPVTVTDPIILPPRKASWLFDDPGDLLKSEIPGASLTYAKGGGGKANLCPFEVPTLDISGFSAVAGPQSGNGAIKVKIGYSLLVDHGIAPNGGGSRVNEYTLMWNLKYLDGPRVDSWKALTQTNPVNNGDADLFINNKNTGGGPNVGSSGDLLVVDTWHTLVISCKGGPDGYMRAFLNGTQIGERTTGDLTTVDNERSTFAPTFLLFADGDNDDPVEEAEFDVAEFAMWDTALDAQQVKKLDRLLGKGIRP